jgi:hypothetical protein
VIVFASCATGSGIWQVRGTGRAKLKSAPAEIEFVVSVELFDGKSGEETVRASEIRPGVEEERHRASPSICIQGKL